ncbi:MAG: cyclic nucleotide-binding domain-containing protein [Candidatus Gracilibacteria bacterium]|nr:cyclic nucleotide-binding domain-containing protein [Candidatus Gracilibacteria bacterium]
MISLEKIKLSEYFKEKTLNRGELLFDEGKIDDNLYFIVSGKLSIEKYTTIEKKDKKQLAIIKGGDFLGEGALSESNIKEVSVLALEETIILYIDAKKDFLKLMEKDPQLAKDILVQIISITNKRTLDSNKYIASVYEINKNINNIKQINYLEIFKILNKINLILKGDYILYLETNPIDDKYLSLKYDSRKNLKMQDILVKKGHYRLEEIGIEKDDRIIVKEIKIANEHLGNIIVGKKDNFSQNEKRIFLAMINSLSGVLKQKKILEEQRNIEFSKI